MIRFGMCGCGGFIEKAVLPMMMRVGKARPVAAFDMNMETLGRVCSDFGIDHKCLTFDEMLRLEEVDVIYVASPNVFHKEQVIQAAEAGKHIFCQKPMGMNTAECEEMLAVCGNAGVKMGMGFCYRFQGAQEYVKRMIREKAVGKVSYLHFSFNLGGYNPETAGWRCNPKLSGGGPLMDLAPHLVDLAYFFTEEKAVSAMAYVNPEKSDEAIELDVSAILQTEHGVKVALDISFVRGNMHNYTIVGDKGQLRALGTMCWTNALPDIGKGRLFLEKGMASEELEFTTGEHLETEIRLFCNALETGTELPVPGEAGLYVQRVIDAIYESGRTQRLVQI